MCILPPDEPANLTDEEQIDQENYSRVEPQDVCGEIDVFLRTEENEASHESSPAEPTPNKKPRYNGAKWKKTERFDKGMPLDQPKKLIEEHPELANMDAFSIFLSLFPVSLVDEIVQQTNLYALQKGKSVKTNREEISQFLGILLLSGYHQVPREEWYWSTAPDIAVPIVPTVMSRQRFRDLKSCFHLVNNQELPAGDKLAKVRPLYEALLKQLQQFGVFTHDLSIDESMVPYYGHHSAKMYIKGKPIRFGFKIWMMCSASGYPYNMQLYSGKVHDKPAQPLGSRVVKDMLSVVKEPSKHSVFFDNFFTSVQLLEELAEDGVRATGTVRDGRTSKCPLTDQKGMKKKERGNYDYRCNGRVVVCRWKDSSVVTCASNNLGVSPEARVSRYSRTAKEKVPTPQPHLLRRYNDGMGGVDNLDKYLSAYRPRMRSKKWWWNLFTNALNISVTSAYLLHKELHKGTGLEVDHIDFRRDVTMSLLRVGALATSARPGPKTHPPQAARKASHALVPTSQGRCAVCRKNTTKKCFLCDKRLHVPCFAAYHGVKTTTQ